jgi:hypothetical protein
LLDLPSAQARLEGGGLLLCRNVSGLPVLPCLVEQGRRRGVCTLVAVAEAGGFGGETPAPILSRVAAVELAGSSSIRSDDLQRLIAAAIATALKRGESDAWLPALAGASGIESRATRWPDLSEQGDVIIACARPAKLRAASEPRHRWPRDGGYDWIEMGEASVAPEAVEARAMTDGIPVDQALWRELTTFSNRALVPSSERSRRDGGPYSGAHIWQVETLQ